MKVMFIMLWSLLQIRMVHDTRAQALSALLDQRPAQQYVEQFLVAADRYQLDWELLPSISLIETGGGQRAQHHNIFGWDSGRARFTTTKQAIFYVAQHLAEMRGYAGKSSREKMVIYNPARLRYWLRIQQHFAELDRLYIAKKPAVEAALARRSIADLE